MSEEIIEEAGLGAAKEIPEDVSNEKVWQALLIKIKQPNLFLPVSDIVTRPSDDAIGTYREMSLGPRRIIENIYTDDSIFEVKFVVTNDPTEHVNIIHTDASTGKRTLEFYLRDKTTKERLLWHVPKHVALGGIQKVIEMAATFSS